jgi:lipopolysaccharide/colanic/teichoic acid biosynthesis glycosyltransferase
LSQISANKRNFEEAHALAQIAVEIDSRLPLSMQSLTSNKIAGEYALTLGNTHKGGKFFNILKFRTMYEQPESYNGSRLTAKDDVRVTRFGRFLRDTKLNELPQLWNVLVGEMSLVGPRPEDP